MRPGTWPARCALLAAAALLAPAAAAGPAPEPFRIGFLGPLSGPLAEAGRESLAGVEHAVAVRGAALSAGGKRRTVEVVTADDGDDPAAALRALETFVKGKVDAVVAASSARTVEAVAAKAGGGPSPVLFVGSAAPSPVLDPSSPLLLLVPSPVDQALAMATSLALRTRKSPVGIPVDCRKPGLVVEELPPFLDQADALERNLGVAQASAGRVLVPPRGKPGDGALEGLRAAGCDRLVLFGEPDLADAVADACAAAGWRVPVLAAPSLFSGTAASFRDGRWREGTLLAALPQWVLRTPRSLEKAHAAARGEAPLQPRTVVAFMAANLVLDAAEQVKRPRKGALLAALRELRYGGDEASMPILEEGGRAALYRFPPWRIGEKGPEPVRTNYLPLDSAGALLGMRPSTVHAPPTPGKVVVLTFGDAESPHPRSIEQDLAALGLHSGRAGSDASKAVLDELLARTIGKLNRLFLKEFDGTPVPGLSFDVSFTTVAPEDLEKGRLWTTILAGAGPADRHGGSHDRGRGNIYLHPSWLVRNLPAISSGRVAPAVGASDLTYLNGEYLWAESLEGNDRADRVRGMIDALAGAFSTRGAKEVGLMAGLSLDKGPDVRSVMNVDGGEGLRETNLHFTPKDAKILEKTLGRCGGE